MRTETLAIVFTDIKGYTARTSAQTHQQNAQMLRRIEKLISPVVRAYDGRVIKSIGDAYMIVFRSPTEAVRCAAAVQDRLHQHNTTSTADEALHIRIAMNIGEVRVHRGDVFGEPVNIAARIESVTPADEIYLSKAVYLTMNRSDLPTEQVGDYELKGLPEPVTVYRVKKFAHLEGQAGEEAEKTAVNKAAGLPFGGTQLSHWRRMKWVRAAYITMWMLAIIGLAGAAYLRYRPTADYSQVVNAVKNAVEQGKAMEALAQAGQLPLDATQERSVVRRYRRDAVALLLNASSFEAAEAEIKALLQEDRRDAETLMLRGMLLAKQGKDIKAALDNFNSALKLQASLAENPDMVSAVVQAYGNYNARPLADQLVDVYLKQRAVPLLQRQLTDGFGDRLARNTIAARLEKLGAADAVDWVALAIDDLKSTSCKVRKAAITRLQTQGDERAVGALMKLAEQKACGAREAKAAAEEILTK